MDSEATLKNIIYDIKNFPTGKMITSLGFTTFYSRSQGNSKGTAAHINTCQMLSQHQGVYRILGKHYHWQATNLDLTLGQDSLKIKCELLTHL
jgi:hypothetical protein